MFQRLEVSESLTGLPHVDQFLVYLLLKESVSGSGFKKSG